MSFVSKLSLLCQLRLGSLIATLLLFQVSLASPDDLHHTETWAMDYSSSFSALILDSRTFTSSTTC